MGGGDLNSKKSWHPNTMKNQERVWKAEQAAAQEKKRIQELQREHAEERDRFELNSMIKQNVASSSGSNDNRLHWMYDKPDRKVQQEDYLLGKSIDKNYDNAEKKEQEIIPAVARRVVGSSMLSSAGDAQVDLARKIREDPLLLVKERERAARAALLNNPLQRRRLTELLRKEQDQKKGHKSKKKSKKKNTDLDKQLAEKLNALGGEKGINLATLLASEDSDTDSSSSEEEKLKKKKKKHKYDKVKKQDKKRKKNKHNSSDELDDVVNKSAKQDFKEVSHHTDCYINKESRKRKSDDSSDCESKYKKGKSNNSDKNIKDRYSERNEATRDDGRKRSEFRSDHNNRDYRHSSERKRRGKEMSSSERTAKLAAMAAAGAERELERGRRVAQQRAASPEVTDLPRRAAPALPDSLEARIHSNRHYIQRDHRHMDKHFARR
ncbi:pre-mRNA-splicing factor CWC25 homolog [Plodia interpunctella]|uniref:pre-mRNA-splicing factor CWC25 homolog n=1 Tax=Plodia interpunctella TaxID=58824 RepID=UPI002368B878|nr:pre-mRNA-splicing factor CWC25 homolog [Plodia interpunctella]